MRSIPISPVGISSAATSRCPTPGRARPPSIGPVTSRGSWPLPQRRSSRLPAGCRSEGGDWNNQRPPRGTANGEVARGRVIPRQKRQGNADGGRGQEEVSSGANSPSRVRVRRCTWAAVQFLANRSPPIIWIAMGGHDSGRGCAEYRAIFLRSTLRAENNRPKGRCSIRSTSSCSPHSRPGCTPRAGPASPRTPAPR
jgi:hypothetical protein